MSPYRGPDSVAADVGLLMLRIFWGINLFLHHGLMKVTHFSQMLQSFPDPFDLGSHISLAFALTSDAICSLLVVLGLATRFAAFVSCVNISVAFFFVHHHPFLSETGELLLLYIGGALTLIFSGAGRFSLDRKLW